QRALAVDGPAEAVEHAPEQALAHTDGERVAGGAGGGADAQPVDRSERHAAAGVAAQADDLRAHGPATGVDVDEVADGEGQAGHLDGEPDDGADHADPLGPGDGEGALPASGGPGGGRRELDGHSVTPRASRTRERAASTRASRYPSSSSLTASPRPRVGSATSSTRSGTGSSAGGEPRVAARWARSAGLSRMLTRPSSRTDSARRRADRADASPSRSSAPSTVSARSTAAR